MRTRIPLILCFLFLAVPALGQDTQRGVKIAPDEDLIDQLAPGASVDKTIVLPELQKPAASRSLVSLPGIRLDRIAIDGGTILGDAEIAAAAAPYTGRMVSIEELEELRRRLSLHYFDKGYVNSGLVLPDQQVIDNVVRFREVRGELTTIQLSGNDALRDKYITKRVGHKGDGPLEINALQTSLQLLEQDPMIGRIDAQLLPGPMPGQGVLRLDVAEKRRWSIDFGANNHRSPAVGGEQLSLLLQNRSVTGRADELTLYGSFADGYGDGFASYSLPLNSHGTSVELYGNTSDSDIVEAPFDEIDIASKTKGYGMSFNQRFHRSLTGAVSGFLGMEIKHNENTLLGEPFSFTDGERDGETDVTVAYAGIELAKRYPTSVAALRMSVRRGLYRAGATQNRIGFGQQSVGPDGLFTSFVMQAQHIHNYGWRDAQRITRLTFQRAWHPLLSMEKLPMGGASTVRGYRENSLVRDNGLIGSLEWQVSLTETDLVADRFNWRRLRLAAFVDAGESWNNTWEGGPSTTRERIASFGLGLLWNPSDNLSATLYWGDANKDLAGGGGDLQDEGIHFSFRWTPWN